MTRCFLVTSTDRARVSLRRYSWSWDKEKNAPTAGSRCPGQLDRFHNADGPVLGVFEQPLDPVERVWRRPIGEPDVPHDDPRWPVKCDRCDYCFTAEDNWQIFADHIYVSADGAEHSLRTNTPGMMWFCPWYFDPQDPRDADKRNKPNSYLSTFYWRDWSTKRPPICVNCPNGDQWCIDSTASNGPGWTIVGEPPVLSATPSILTPGYHGWLGCNGAQPGYFTGPL